MKKAIRALAYFQNAQVVHLPKGCRRIFQSIFSKSKKILEVLKFCLPRSKTIIGSLMSTENKVLGIGEIGRRSFYWIAYSGGKRYMKIERINRHSKY